MFQISQVIALMVLIRPFGVKALIRIQGPCQGSAQSFDLKRFWIDTVIIKWPFWSQWSFKFWKLYGRGRGFNAMFSISPVIAVMVLIRPFG